MGPHAKPGSRGPPVVCRLLLEGGERGSKTTDHNRREISDYQREELHAELLQRAGTGDASTPARRPDKNAAPARRPDVR